MLKNKNAYSLLIGLKLSKEYIKNNELSQSEEILNILKDITNEENLKNIIKFRILDLEIEQKEINKAKKTISEIKKKGWENVFMDKQGDIYCLENKKKLATITWKRSLKYQIDNKSKEIIKMKIQKLKK
ncbi:MAG: tetratricopeptide repeat protein [Buchnera aphidicola (Tetraneura akinire)]